MKTNLENQVEVNKSLITQQQFLRTKYDDAIKVNQDVQQRQNDLIAEIEQLHNAILHLCPSASRQLSSIESIGKPPAPVVIVKPISSSPAPTLSSTPPPQMITSRTMSVPTAAALKMGVGFPLHNLRKDDTGRILSTQCITNDELLNECGICKKCSDQHLLSKCDTCHLYYHLGCLNPPLTRHPKRSKLYAWQCSECDNSDDSTNEKVIIPKGPRRSRIRYSKDGPIIPDPLRDSFGSEKSTSLSKKSDDSTHRNLNGSEKETIAEVKVSEAMNPPETPVKETFVSETVPTTSTPITEVSESNVKVEENSWPKKRGRKPRAKQSPPIKLESPVPIDLSSQQSSTLPKETTSENQHEADSNSFNEQTLIISPMEAVQSPSFPEFIKMPTESPKAPKKGRPRKEKPSITQISNKLQKKQEINQQEVEPKSEVTLLDLSRKIECPLEQYRTFADSIPYPAPTVELPKIADESESIPVLPLASSDSMLLSNCAANSLTNGVIPNGEDATRTGTAHHKQKKRKNHKRRHSHSPSSVERVSSGKKHKKKKHKNRDLELEDEPRSYSLNSHRLPEQPRIKMKFCAKFVQAGDDKKIMWSLPSSGGDASNVDSLQNNSHEETFSNGSGHMHQDLNSSEAVPMSLVKSPKHETMTNPLGNGHSPTAKKRKKTLQQSPGGKKARLVLNISPNKGISAPVIAPSHFPASVSSTPSSTSVSTTVLNESVPLSTQSCDVCQMPGLNQNLVK